MNKTRSPRFPFIPIGQALKHTGVLHEKFAESPTPALKAMKALGFDGMSGKANKVIAAMRAYGLIGVEKVEKGRRITISPLGVQLTAAPRAPRNRNGLRLAALAPLPFRRLWLNRPGITEEQLVAILLKRDFTEQGAQRAAKVYMANVRFAALEDPEFRQKNEVPPLPKRPKVSTTVPGPRNAGKAKAGACTPGPENASALQVPLGDKTALIPVGISAADFKLLVQTLRLWKPTLVREPAA